MAKRNPCCNGGVCPACACCICICVEKLSPDAKEALKKILA